jgi:peptidoglycan/xylan/chitin deacetylase (PgdA/CDA1 family)
MSIAFSVDLEPNKDGSFDGVAEAMDWYDNLVPQGTVYTTYRVATERPDIVSRLADEHDIGVHVHPKEFGHDHDDLATLTPERQRNLIAETRDAVAGAADVKPTGITAFRAGRHKASSETLSVLSNLGFIVDASVNVRYRDHMPDSVTDTVVPFQHECGIIELPTTYAVPSLVSRVGLRAGPGGNVTATAHELRTDRRCCTGLRALSWLFEQTGDVVSMYMHPYDATDYHEGLENTGTQFRHRLKKLFSETNRQYITASDLCSEQT